ncbi:MAG TPA: ELWxxDGT repeat protein [Thermoanaerobaculia bacterium]|nr:ELWxxDGT repeat protein [Thermoanaerobaculia bacterium]
MALGDGAVEGLLGWPDSHPILIGNRAVVSAYPPADSNNPGERGIYQIWGTDGTAAGMVQLLTDPHLVPFPPSSSSRWGAIFFAYPADDEQDLLLGEPVTIYQTDGTVAGTLPLLELPRGMIPDDPVDIGGHLYFLAYEYDRDGFRLWTSDGTIKGTAAFFAGTTVGFHPPYFQRFGNSIVFLALGVDGIVGLWRTDGTPEGTTLVARLADDELWNGEQRWSFRVVAGKIYFWAPASPDVAGPLHPWVSDGTAAGTHRLADVALAEPPYILAGWGQFAAAGQKVFFAADDGIHGNELWSTDGTPGGTVLAADLWPGYLSSDPRELTAIGEELVLVAQTPLTGAELHVFALCTGAAQRVADLASGPSWGEPENLLWDSNRQILVFAANNGLHGREPWAWVPSGDSGPCSSKAPLPAVSVR